MGFKTGIIGLPNVGKSTLFNALTRTAIAQAANFPFCTIEPNVGDVSVPDNRLDKLAHIAESKKIVPARMTFVDIAGLVKGASKGEGLGNQFLANIRECDAIAHVLRCFENADVSHVYNKINPKDDAETVEMELMLADLENVEKRISNLTRKFNSGDKEVKSQLLLLERVKEELISGKAARKLKLEDDEKKDFHQFQLLSSKPILYVANVDEESAALGNQYSAEVKELAEEQCAASVIISAGIEEEISSFDDPEEMKMFLLELGLSDTGLNRLIRVGYNLLSLKTFFTVGPKESHAWTIKENTLAPQAARKIHTDFERGFIRAEAISYSDYIEFNGENGAKEAGKLRSEGKNYLVQDGDILNFLFNG